MYIILINIFTIINVLLCRLDDKEISKLWRVLVWSNLLFFLFDVCLPAWDFINDLRVLISVYWTNSNFDLVSF